LKIITPETEPEQLQPHLLNVLLRFYEENLSRMMEDMDDLDDSTEYDDNMNEWFHRDGSNDRD
jgi:hypothetical protein